MRINKIVYLIMLISIFFTACIESEKDEVYTIQGQLIDGTNKNNKFSLRKLKFLNELDHQNIVTLGETTTDKNGNFSLSYEFSKNYKINFMRILIDTNIIAAKNLHSLEIGSNWTEKFYLSDSAIFKLHIDKSLGNNDTLYFRNWDSTYIVIGPKNEGYINTFKCLNFNQFGIIVYGINRKYFNQEQSVINFIPTGEPIVDELFLKLNL